MSAAVLNKTPPQITGAAKRGRIATWQDTISLLRYFPPKWIYFVLYMELLADIILAHSAATRHRSPKHVNLPNVCSWHSAADPRCLRVI